MGNCGGAARKRKVLLLGLDGAGKTSMALALEKPGEIMPPPGTVPSGQASTVERTHNGLSLTLWDVGGGSDSMRPFWVHHMTGVSGVVFLVDASARDSFPEAAECLKWCARDERLQRIPFVILLNKMDVVDDPDGAEAAARAELKLETVLSPTSCEYTVIRASAAKGEGLAAALDFLTERSDPL